MRIFFFDVLEIRVQDSVDACEIEIREFEKIAK